MRDQSNGAIENIRFSNTGIDYLLHQGEVNTDTIAVEIIKKENQIIKVHLSHWGIFEKAYTLSQFRKKKFVKTALIGSSINSQESPTLFLQETQTPLTLVGSTQIKGLAYLPSQGVKSGYIAGNSYYGNQLIYGSINTSTPILPKLNKICIDALESYCNGYKPQNQEDYINVETSRRIVNSFQKKTKIGYSKESIVLENCNIIGNIIIKSDVSINIKNTANLKDIILIAPIIEIEDGTTGNFQAIATQRIAVGKTCKLDYPSALVLFQDNKNNPKLAINPPLDNQIFIDSTTTIKGSVCYFRTKEYPDFKTQIVLETKSRIKGQVYCTGNFELKGSVSGSVYTKQFIANQAGSIFINHIYNGTIENENIPIVFGGIVLEQTPKTIMKWLY